MRRVLVLLVVLVFVLMGARYYRCHLRNEKLKRQIKGLAGDVQRNIKVGASKSIVDQFFAERHIQVSISDGEVSGVIHASGCAPTLIPVCSDEAIITIRVKLDSQGFVVEPPNITDMYLNCV